MEESEAITVQRDDERERRRMRDRQRRQSMTVEQRERHLATRRRNYQLRRVRAETSNSKLDIVVPQHPRFEMVISSENQELNLTPEISIQNEGFDCVGLVLGQEKIDSKCLQFNETLETISVDVTKTLRLSRIRCLARSLNHSGGGVDGDHENVAEIMSKNGAEATLQFGDAGSGRLAGGVRLSRFKRLARGLNTAISEISGQANRERAQLPEETQVVSCNKPIFGQPTIAGEEAAQRR